MLQRLLFCLAFSSVAIAAETQAVKVSDNHRYLVTSGGKPFFYFGDTAWELFHRLNREEADAYLADRAAKKFNVIQAVVLAEFDGLTAPNAYGHLALKDNDPKQPVEEYFQHVDYIVNKAQSLGLYVGMLPSWGDKVNKKWGIGPEIFTPENGRAFGEFLGKRYKDKAIIWIVGGDRPVDKPEHAAVWRAIAEGLKSGDGGAHLFTFHCMGEHSSSEWFHADAWLGFNMLQSGHGRKDSMTAAMITKDYARTPPKPCLDGEANYEDHPINWKPQNGWFDEYDVRKTAYWSVFAGACGYTYGCHDIWQFWTKERKPVSSARTDWHEAIKLPASGQIQFVRKLVESRPYLTRIPDQSLIVGDAGAGTDHVQSARGEDGSYAFVYFPSGKPAKINTSKLSGEKLTAYWFDPRLGTSKPLDAAPKSAEAEFTPPSSGRGNDWVLVIDDAAKNYPAP